MPRLNFKLLLSGSRPYLKIHIVQLIAFLAFVALQWHNTNNLTATQRYLPPPLTAGEIRLLSLGEPAIAARVIGFWLLSFDMRAGRIVQWHSLDYRRLSAWLTTAQDLDLLSDDAGMLAGGVFTEINDPQRVEQMLELVRRQFVKAPAVNWHRRRTHNKRRGNGRTD